ncbi:hypothetical protein QBE53_12730 [Vallitaleaceae bacterium 9-2]
MSFPSIFIIFIILVALFQHHLRKNMRQENQNRAQFWSKEEKSLSTRRKELHPEDYITPNLTWLTLPDIPSLEAGQKIHYQQVSKHLQELSTMDMMNFSNLTNTEVRIRFGTANQTIITQNEANYNHFLKALAEYGHLMIELEEYQEAIHAFEEAIRIGSDYSDHYITLAKLYAQHHQHQKLSDLKHKASSLDSLNKTMIEKKLAAF